MSTPGIVSVSVIINKNFHSPTEPCVIIHLVVNQFFGADVLILSLSNNNNNNNNNNNIFIYLFIYFSNQLSLKSCKNLCTTEKNCSRVIIVLHHIHR